MREKYVGVKEARDNTTAASSRADQQEVASLLRIFASDPGI
jgi:hypothetical protein